MKERITIAIAEDHAMIRQGLVSLLKPHKNIELLFEAANGLQLLEELKTQRPHVLLLDIEMPIMRAQEILEKINQKYPRLKVIIVSAYFQRDYIVECFRLGVKAFLAKDERIEKVVEAIHSVHAHGIYADLQVTKILAEEVFNSGKGVKPDKPLLSESELQVLRLLVKGHPRKQVAEMLSVKPETVNFHLSNMRRKTNTDNTAALISHAIKNKLLPDGF